jgi:hypothetical protein
MINVRIIWRGKTRGFGRGLAGDEGDVEAVEVMAYDDMG